MCPSTEPIFKTEYLRLTDPELADYFLFRKSPLVGLPKYEPIGDPTEAAELICSGNIDFNGEIHPLDHTHPWGRNPSRDKEWMIGLHKNYFSIDLMRAFRLTGETRYLETWMALTSSFMDHTKPGALAISDAQVEAKRIETWISVYRLLCEHPGRRLVDGAFLRKYLERLANDALYVSGNLRPSRNHRTFQLYAMFLVGTLFPEFAAADQFAQDGREKLVTNLLDDFEASGVHVERSTHYHNITLEAALGFVSVARANGLQLPAELNERLRAAATFAAYVQFPDGEIPLLNDSDNGNHATMLDLGARLFGDAPLRWAASSGGTGSPPSQPASRDFGGYIVFSEGWGRDPKTFRSRQHLVFDCAPLGVGSHSHYDLMNFCWYADGRQIIVDPGRYTYDPEPGPDGLDWRHEFKSTRFHNTVEIDGRDQTRYLSKASIVPSGVEKLDRKSHVQKHGPPIEIVTRVTHVGEHTDFAACTGQSYEYTPLHSRALIFMRREYIVIFDNVDIQDGSAHSTILRFHLSQEAGEDIVLQSESTLARLKGLNFALNVQTSQDARARLTQGWLSKCYGVKYPAPVLEIDARSEKPIKFCSLLMPASSGGKRLTLHRFDYDHGSDVQAANVRLSVDGAIYEDLIEFNPSSLAIACTRRDEAGALIHD